MSSTASPNQSTASSSKKRKVSSKKRRVSRPTKKTSSKANKENPNHPNTKTHRCGLCGSTRKLTRTECCNNLICDDEDQYILFSYAANSCYRNHDRYTLCASHMREGHKGQWQSCTKCREFCAAEMVCWYGTNEFNFEKMPDPPSFTPTHCAQCNAVIHPATEIVLINQMGYNCIRCIGKRHTDPTEREEKKTRTDRTERELKKLQ